MKGTVWQRCTRCMKKVNGADARKRHKASGCAGNGSTWAMKADLGRDADGKRHQQVRAGFATEADADRALRELLGKVDGGRYVTPSKRTLADYLEGEWLPATAPPRVAHSTHAKRTLHVSSYVVPRIGRVPLAEVNGAGLDRLYAALLRDGGRDGAPLAASTVRDVHRTLNKAFTDARRWQLLDRNPCEESEPPRLDQVADDARAAVHAWSADELGRFLSATAGHRHGPVFYVAGTTGMRRSELLGLRWEDVDLDRATIRVVQKLVEGPDGYELRRSTKTASGARTIALDADTVAVLREHRRRQLEYRLALGTGYQDHGLVFCREDGVPLSPAGVTQAFRRAADSCIDCTARLDTARRREVHEGSGCTGGPLPRIRFHDVRHTHATILLQNGVPVRTVSQRLGHASAVVTMTIYSHVLPGDDQGAADRFGRLLAGTEG
jgi:integrase